MNEQDSSIYPHLYVTNTIGLPQYFTGGFLQQDPVSHLERSEEYVPQLSNMEKTTRLHGRVTTEPNNNHPSRPITTSYRSNRGVVVFFTLIWPFFYDVVNKYATR
ncbi:hypothetical protein J6590_069556 [Homalodisca vitripennis]|nr:hypothetical protein J6590_069556 [Homalodisca vitripennis]